MDNHFSTSMRSKQTAKKNPLFSYPFRGANSPPPSNGKTNTQNQTSLRHHDLFYLSPSSLPSNPKFPHSTVIHRSFSWKLITAFPQHHPHHLRKPCLQPPSSTPDTKPAPPAPSPTAPSPASSSRRLSLRFCRLWAWLRFLSG